MMDDKNKITTKPQIKTDMFWPILCIVLATGPWVLISFFPNYLDESFKNVGFCQSTKVRQGYDSFEVCFWVDLIGSIVLYLILKILGNRIAETDRMELISALPGTIIHGCAHYYQFYQGGKFWSDGQDPLKVRSLGDDPWYLYAGNLIFVFGFQYNLQIGVGNFKSMFGATFIIALFQILFVPPLYALTYVNSWIFLTDILVKAFKPKNRNSDWGDTLLNIMLVLLLVEPLIEATRCTNGLELYGGHAIFDSWIVIYLYVWLAVSYYRNRNQHKVKSS